MVWWVIGEPLCSLAEARKYHMAPPELCALESREQGAWYHSYNYRRRLQPNPSAAIRSTVSWGPESVSLHRIILWQAGRAEGCAGLSTSKLAFDLPLTLHLHALCSFPRLSGSLVAFHMMNTWQIILKFGVIIFLQTTVGNMSLSS